MEGSSIWVKTSSMKVDSEGSIRCKCDLLALVQTAKTDKNRGRQFLRCSRYKSKSEPGCGFGRWLDNAHDEWPKNLDDLNERSVKSVARAENEVNQLRLEIASKEGGPVGVAC